MFTDLDKHLIEAFGEVAPVILPPSRPLENDPFEGLPVIRGTKVKATSETVLKLSDLRISKRVWDKPRTQAPRANNRDEDARGPKSNGKNRGLSREQQGKPPLELRGASKIFRPEASQPKPHGNIELPKWTLSPRYQHFFSWVFLNNFYERIETDHGQKTKAQRDMEDIKGYFYGLAADAANSAVRNRLSRLRIRSTLILGCNCLELPKSAFELIPEGELKVPLEEMDFTNSRITALPDEIEQLMLKMRYDAHVLLRDSNDETLSAEQAAYIDSLPRLSGDEAKEVRRAMKKVMLNIYQHEAREYILTQIAAERGIPVEDLYPLSPSLHSELEDITQDLAQSWMKTRKASRMYK